MSLNVSLQSSTLFHMAGVSHKGKKCHFERIPQRICGEAATLAQYFDIKQSADFVGTPKMKSAQQENGRINLKSTPIDLADKSVAAVVRSKKSHKGADVILPGKFQLKWSQYVESSKPVFVCQQTTVWCFNIFRK
jgi:hypothetical protein